MSIKQILVSIAICAFVSTVAGGCDPAGPAAEGIISLSEEVDLAEFTTLELRMIFDPGADFDAADGVPMSEESYSFSVNLTEIAFPYEYYIGAGVGTTQQAKWAVVAWLSNEAFADAPISGEWYGAAAFKVKECGGTFDGYCDTTRGVDFTLDTQLP